MLPLGRGFHTRASGQYVMNCSPPLQTYPPKSYKHKPRRKSLTCFVLLKSPAETTHCPTLAKILFHRVICSQDVFFFFFPRLFLEDFVINCAKKIPRGEDVVWLREKAALRSFAINIWSSKIFSSELLMCDKPPAGKHGLVMWRRAISSLWGIFSILCFCCKIQIIFRGF